MNRRLNIGLLIDDPNNYFTSQACKGADIAARALDANLFIFPGHYIGKPDGRFENTEFEYQYNIVFDLPTRNNVDILYVMLGTIGSRADKKQQKAFVDGLPPIPVVNLFADIEGYPYVTFDNAAGIGQVLDHLVDRHGAEKIGYVSGPMTNKDAVDRLEAFRAYIQDRGFPLEEKQIVYGDFTENSDQVVVDLLDANDDLDAILFANDNMAVGGYRVLEERGLVPGKDILVAGYDDDIFTASMTPPLTTVENNPAVLTYKAVLSAPDFIDKGQMSNMELRTHLVQRRSCGCLGLDPEEIGKRLHTEGMLAGDRAYVEAVTEYLFDVFDDENTRETRALLEDFCIRFSEYLRTGQGRERTDLAFKKLVDSEILRYVDTERLFNVLQTMQSEGIRILQQAGKDIILDDMVSEYYRQLSLKGLNMINSELSKKTRVSRLVNSQMGNIFISSHEGQPPYDLLLNGLSAAGFSQSFLYFFQGNQRHMEDDLWKCPKSLLLIACSDKDGVRTPSEEMQLIRTEKMFINEFVRTKDRMTMMVFPLFVGESLYGFFVNQLDISDISNVSIVAFQLSVSIKSLLMIEEQNNIKKELQTSLEKFMLDNSILNRAAKIDELTGLYNRRGFLEYTQKIITDPSNRGCNALICYADMDNLKMINDIYGHDDGDFALREIAAILNDTFRSTDVIGRLGGDEFVVCAVVKTGNYEETIKERIRIITEKHNKSCGKPYPIEMSTGICKFICSNNVDIYELIEQADEKLYVEKNKKKATQGSYR